jgi:hypothetical protein
MRCVYIVVKSGAAFLLPVLCAMTMLVGFAQGHDYYTTVPTLPTVKIGSGAEGATPASTVMGKEYSHTNWLEVYQGGGDPNLVNVDDHDASAAADPLQVVSWDGIAGRIGGNSGSVDAFDYGVPGFEYAYGQVDAIANSGDYLFSEVIANQATLLFSVTADIDQVSVLDGTIVEKAHVRFEDPFGPDAQSPGDIWAPFEAPPINVGPGPGVNHHLVMDVDALEVWGPEPPSHDILVAPCTVTEGYLPSGQPTADANRFSLDNDSVSGVSVWAYNGPANAVTSYISHAQIVEAVEFLFLGTDELRFEDAMREAIDVDGTMVHDVNVAEDGSTVWDVGDALLFTIDPADAVENEWQVLNSEGNPAGIAPMIDGGEIMVLKKIASGEGLGTFDISFLSHGGHLWNTAFNVKDTFGYYYEDVDALEAVGTLTGEITMAVSTQVPEPSTLLLMVFGLLGLTIGGRWRSR